MPNQRFGMSVRKLRLPLVGGVSDHAKSKIWNVCLTTAARIGKFFLGSDEVKKQTPPEPKNHLMEAYIVYQAKIYDIKGKQYLKTLEKYYIVDIGLRNAMLRNAGNDVARFVED